MLSIKHLNFGISLLLVVTFFSQLHSQKNLVINGSFEDFKSLKLHYILSNNLISDSFFLKKYNSLSVNIDKWGLGVYTTDSNYINKESKNNVYLPISIFNRVPYTDFIYQYENAIGVLCKELIRDKEYKVEFYAKPKSIYFSNKIEVIITDSVYSKLLNNEFTIKKIKNQETYIEKLKPTFSYDKLFDNTDSFTKMSFIYKAKGKEKYIIIGNITSEKPTILKKSDDPSIKGNGVGIIINCIEITPLDTNESTCAIVKPNSTENINEFDTILFHQEFFDINKDITIYNNKKIQELRVKESEVQQILIIGFTDEVASSEFNLKLAKKRADNYKSFLYKNNINYKITTLSKGEINDNNNRYNRRIDIYIIKKSI